MDLILAIAMLCGTPAGKYPGSNYDYYYTKHDVLTCQKYYTKCVKSKVPTAVISSGELTKYVLSCIEEKK